MVALLQQRGQDLQPVAHLLDGNPQPVLPLAVAFFHRRREQLDKRLRAFSQGAAGEKDDLQKRVGIAVAEEVLRPAHGVQAGAKWVRIESPELSFQILVRLFPLLPQRSGQLLDLLAAPGTLRLRQ